MDDRRYYKIARRVNKILGVESQIHDGISRITKAKFDTILALDVLEHVDDLDAYIHTFKDLSHENTRVVVSGPTESILYKAGRWLAGFSGDYHIRNIYEIERAFMESGFKRIALKKLYFPITHFRITAWCQA